MQEENKNIVSLFDGISCLQVALNELGIKYENYYASEVNKYPVTITQANFAKTIQLGDVQKITGKDLPEKVWLLAGGSPCQGFSFAGKQLNFEDERSKLFFDFVRLKEEVKPKYWLLENVRMSKKVEAAINKILGCKPIRLDSALVSAQRRKRLYWTNIPVNSMPKNQFIFIKDILQPISEVAPKYFLPSKRNLERVIEAMKAQNIKEGDVLKLTRDLRMKEHQSKASCLTAGGNSGGNHSDMDVICVAMRGRKNEGKIQQQFEFNKTGKSNCLTSVTKDNFAFIYQIGRGFNKGGIHEEKSPTLTSCAFDRNNPVVCLNTYDSERDGAQTYQQDRVYSIEDKSPALLASLGGRLNIADNSSEQLTIALRRLTPIEYERLQNLPDNYTNYVSDTRRYEAIGNGWTVGIIKHILKHIK